MGWSLTIGRVFGIPVKVHVTLLLLVGVVVAMTASTPHGGIAGLLFAALVFGSVLFHELGHALVARRFSVETREIMLLPIGGAAVLSKSPDKPSDEMWIALAGPAVSLLVALAAWLVTLVSPVEVARDLLVVNLILGLFNLIPAFPLDGGRALRAGLVRWMGMLRATRTAAKLGRLLAIALVVLGIYHGQFLLGIVGGFIFVAAAAEERGTMIRAIIGHRTARDAVQPAPQTLGVASTAAEAARVFRAHIEARALPVVFGDAILGVVHRDVIEACAGNTPDAPLQNFLDRNVLTHNGSGSLLALLQEMGRAGSRIAIIVDEGSLRGLVVLEAILDDIRAARHAEF